MRFFDCNAFFGLPMVRPLAPVPTADALLAEMDRAGVDRALVWHIAQHDASPQAGNQLLADDEAFGQLQPERDLRAVGLELVERGDFVDQLGELIRLVDLSLDPRSDGLTDLDGL